MRASVVSVNVGTPEPVDWAGSLGLTAIRKRAVDGPVAAHTHGLEGDECADKRDHGGTHKAVYAFAQEDLDLWSERLGQAVAPGMFGENLTTRGIDVNEARVGETWRVGTAVLQVVDVRIPCNVFKNWLGLLGFDTTRWVKRFAEVGRPGPYLAVLEEGHVAAGDAVTVTWRPEGGLTVSEMFRAMTTQRELLPRLLDIDGLDPQVYAAARRQAALQQVTRR